MLNILKLLDKAAKSARKHMQDENAFREAFVQRYGVDFSDADCDPIIDVCSGHGTNNYDLKSLDKMVFEYCGLSPIKKETP